MGLGSSIDSLSTYAESDYASPISQSFPEHDAPYMNSPIPMYNSYSSRNSTADSPAAGMMADSRGPTSCPEHFYAQSEISSSISSHQNQYDIIESRQHQPSPGAHDLFYDDDILGKFTSAYYFVHRLTSKGVFTTLKTQRCMRPVLDQVILDGLRSMMMIHILKPLRSRIHTTSAMTPCLPPSLQKCLLAFLSSWITTRRSSALQLLYSIARIIPIENTSSRSLLRVRVYSMPFVPLRLAIFA